MSGPRAGSAARVASPLTGRSRVLRITALGSASLLLATGAHLVGGAALPGPGVLVVSAFLVGLVAVTATSRRCGAALLLALLAAEQGLLHVAFAAAGPGTACQPAGPHLLHSGAGPLSCTPTDAALAAGAAPAWSMWLAHLLATVVTAWLLTRGETALWALAAHAVGAATAAPGARPTRPRAALLGAPLPAAVLVLLSRAGARGPPVAVLQRG